MTVDESPPPGLGSAIWALSLADGRKVVTSAWFLVGFGVAMLGSAVFLRAVLTDDRATWDDDAWTVGAGFILWAIFTMVAVNRAALRDHWEHTREQHEALPVGAGTRSAAMVGATLWPAAITTMLLALVAGLAATRLPVPSVTVLHVVHNGALVMMLGALGVALAAWIPSSFVAPVAAFALYLVHPGEVAASWHAIWPFATLDTASMELWHMVYLIALATVLTLVASPWRELGRVRVVSFVTATAVAAVAGAIIVNGACPSVGPCLH